MFRLVSSIFGLVAAVGLMYALGPACAVPQPSCDDDSDCLDTLYNTCSMLGYCIDPAADCTSDSDCGTDACEDGVCVPPLCVTDSECPDPGTICVSPRCAPGCNDDADCLPGRCDLSSPPPICLPRPCEEDADCPLESICEPDIQDADKECIPGCRDLDANGVDCHDVRP